MVEFGFHLIIAVATVNIILFMFSLSRILQNTRFIIFEVCDAGYSCFALNRYTRKNAQVVTNPQQTCSNAVPTTCQQDVSTACRQLATRLLSSTDLLQVVLTTCYRPAIQQFVNKL
jgi:hypothetical protein